MKTKVMYVISSLSDGGAETIVKDYCLNIDKEKYEPQILVVYDRYDTPNAKSIFESGIQTIPIYKNWNIFTRIFNKLCGKKYTSFRINKIILKEKPELIHVHQNFLHYLDVEKIECLDARVIYTCHSEPQRYFSGTFENEYLAAVRLIDKKRLTLVGLHKKMRDELNRMFSIDNTKVIRNCIDVSNFENLQFDKNVYKQELGIPCDALVLGHVGRFFNIKNQDFIVEIFKELVKKNNHYFLLLVGDGEDKERIIEKLIGFGLKNKFLVLSNRTDVNKLLAIMDIFVFPSKLEGFPLALIEAQAAGLRCIVSDTINNESFLTKYVTSLSIQESVEKWVEEINQDMEISYSQDERRKIMKYDVKSVMLELDSLYQSVLSERGKR